MRLVVKADLDPVLEIDLARRVDGNCLECLANLIVRLAT